MATKPKTTIGTMACMCCGHEIPVKQADNGTLNAACAWCDFPAYAKAGTQAHRIITGKLKNQQPEPTPALAQQAPAAIKTVAKQPGTPAPARVPANILFGG